MNQPRWVNVNREVQEIPMFVATVPEALAFYGSIYDENQTHSLPAMIGVPSAALRDPLTCMILSTAASRAGSRTREELINAQND